MTFGANDGQPSDVRAFVQAAALAAVLSLSLTACTVSHTEGPEAWWHESIGGKINQDRPPPPGDKDPAPSLATVPPKPQPADAAAWNRRTANLMTDRVAARQSAALTPIPGAAPLPGAPPPPAVLSGPTTVPGLGPATPSQSPKDRPPGLGASLPAVAKPASPASPSHYASGPIPALPDAPPARPNIAPAPPPAPTPATAAPPILTTIPTGGTEVEFVGQSATLTETALEQVKALAAARGQQAIAITGRGDASSSDAVAQAAAVGLGLRRAQAIATALVAEGVPNRVLRLNAQAAGRGGDLRLLQ